MKKSLMIYKKRGTEDRIQVTKPFSDTWRYQDPATGKTIDTTQYQLKQLGYVYMKKESKLKVFDDVKRKPECTVQN